MDSRTLKSKIEAGLVGAVAEVTDTAGDNRHFRALVIAPQFEGVSRLQQHRMVTALLQEEIQGSSAPVHAFQLETYTPEAWKSRA